MHYLKKLTRMAVASGTAVALLTTTPVMADSVAESLQKGRIRVGIQGDNPPWGFIDSSGTQQGFEADIARAFAVSLGVEPEFFPLAIANRIPALTTEKVDILFATLSMTPERAKSIQYSVPHAGNDISLVAPKTTKIAGLEDWHGLTIGVPRSSVVDTSATNLAPADTEIYRFDDDSANIQALLSGQVDAVGANQFYVQRLNDAKPGVYEDKMKLQVFFNGVGTRLGEKDWNEAINTFLIAYRQTPEYAAVYEKWLRRAAPDYPETLEDIPFHSN